MNNYIRALTFAFASTALMGCGEQEVNFSCEQEGRKGTIITDFWGSGKFTWEDTEKGKYTASYNSISTRNTAHIRAILSDFCQTGVEPKFNKP